MTGTVWLSGFSMAMYSWALLDPIPGSDIDSHCGPTQTIQTLFICFPFVKLR